MHVYCHVLPVTYATLPNAGAAGTTHEVQLTGVPENAPVEVLHTRTRGAPKNVALHVHVHVPGDVSAKWEFTTAAGAHGVGTNAPARLNEPKGVRFAVPSDEPAGQKYPAGHTFAR